MLQADGAADHCGHRLARDLGVAMRHGDGDLFVQAHDEFGLGVLAVVQQRFLQAAERRGGEAGDVVDAEGLDRIDHEVRA